MINKHQLFLLFILWGLSSAAFSSQNINTIEPPVVVFDLTQEQIQVYALTHTDTLRD